MTKKILSFEEFAISKNLKNSEEIAEETNELCETCGEEPCVCEGEESDDDDDDDEVEGTEESDDDDEEESDEHERLESPDEEAKEKEEEAAGGEEAEDDQKVKSVSEMLKEAYNKMVDEMCEYHKDDYPDHTMESYLKENAALAATLIAQKMEESHAIIHEGDELTTEMYEAVLNTVKESFTKKIDELKETWSAK
jgi:hypothetical protein